MSGVMQAVWHGTSVEGRQLELALSHHCACTVGEDGRRTATCPVHAAFISDQRWLDGLLVQRRFWSVHLPNAGQRVVMM